MGKESIHLSFNIIKIIQLLTKNAQLGLFAVNAMNLQVVAICFFFWFIESNQMSRFTQMNLTSHHHPSHLRVKKRFCCSDPDDLNSCRSWQQEFCLFDSMQTLKLSVMMMMMQEDEQHACVCAGEDLGLQIKWCLSASTQHVRRVSRFIRVSAFGCSFRMSRLYPSAYER